MGRPRIPLTTRLAVHSMDAPSGCRIWTGNVNADHYGRIHADGRMRYAHRVAYELAHGPIPEGLVIDHLCRRPRCIKPEHLQPVTIAENLRRGSRRGPRAVSRKSQQAKYRALMAELVAVRDGAA